MSDEKLIDALRRMSPRLDMLDCENVLTAADRISAQAAEIERLRAKLAKALEALGEIATDEHPLGWIAITALAELTGAQKDGH